jgi:hypothetical protein
MSSEPQAVQAAPITGGPPAGGATYRLSAAGRRTALILLLGVVAVWVFAAWTLVTQALDGLSGPEWVTALLMLGILVVAPVVGWTLLEERSATITADAHGLTYRSITGIHLAYTWPEITSLDPTPAQPSRWARLFMDNPASEGMPPTTEQRPAAGRNAALTHQSNNSSNASPTGIDDDSPLSESPAEAEDRDAAADEAHTRPIPVAVTPPPAARIAGPVIGALWRQAHGDTLPLPGELENRAALLATIRAHRQPQESSPPA